MDYYEILGLAKSDEPSEKEIRAAYRSRAKECHPDTGGDRAEFDKVQEAYDNLHDPEKRAYYDATGSKLDQLIERPELQIILEIFNDLLDKGVPLHVNYVSLIGEIMTATLEDVKDKRKHCETENKRYEKVMKKFKGKGPEASLFKNALLMKIKKNNVKILRVNKLESVMGESFKVLQDFEFEPDPREPEEDEESTSFQSISEVFKMFDIGMRRRANQKR